MLTNPDAVPTLQAALWLHAHPAFVASLFLGFSQRDDAAVVPLPF